MQGIQLADAVNQESQEQNNLLSQPQQLNQNLFPMQQPLGPNNLSLPKLG